MYESKNIDYLNNLYTESGIQDNLLQSYRNFHLVMQSIFIAIGTGISIMLITTNELKSFILMLIIHISVAFLAVYSLVKIRKVIIARGKDVDYWHNKIIEAEKKLESHNKYFTRFKIYQKFHRKNIDDEEFKRIEIKEEFLSSLTEKGKGHTRKVLDNNLFYVFIFIWLIFIFISIYKLYLFL